MKIAGVRTFVVGNPPPGFGGRYFVFLKLVTDGGVEGLGITPEDKGVTLFRGNHQYLVHHVGTDVIRT